MQTAHPLALARPPIMPMLLDAARAGDLAGFTEARQQVADAAEARDSRGRNALHLAAEGGHAALCRLLAAELKWDVDTRDAQGRLAEGEGGLFWPGSTAAAGC